MSILATQTNFLLHNNTSHFLEITISAEQDEEFRMMKQKSTNVVPVANDTNNTSSFLSWVMEGLLDTFTGSKLQEIKINLPGKAKVPMVIRCTSTLSINTNIKSNQCSDIISGDFQLGPEYHGESMFIKWEPLLGYGYDGKGNVAIGGKIPTHRDMAINCTFEDSKKKKITGISVIPACCKVAFK